MLATFFSENIFKLHNALKSAPNNESPHTSPKNTPTNLSFVNPVTEEKVSKIILNSSNNSFCDLDSLPTSVLKQCLPALLYQPQRI